MLSWAACSDGVGFALCNKTLRLFSRENIFQLLVAYMWTEIIRIIRIIRIIIIVDVKRAISFTKLTLLQFLVLLHIFHTRQPPGHSLNTLCDMHALLPSVGILYCKEKEWKVVTQPNKNIKSYRRFLGVTPSSTNTHLTSKSWFVKRTLSWPLKWKLSMCAP